MVTALSAMAQGVNVTPSNLQQAVNRYRQTNPDSQQPRQFTPSQKLGYAQRIIEGYYVDSIDSEEVVEAAIVAMLRELDPHSVYSDPDETRELTAPLEGNFSGIGIQFNMVEDTLMVIQTTAGGPCEKVGILPGDRILAAGDSIISGVKRPNSKVIKILRGPKGTSVDLKVLRRGQQEPIMFTVVRDDIPVYSIDAAFMADPTTGYVRISRFGETTAREFTKAVDELRAQGMQNIIIDLQDNGGGYLSAATELADMLLPKGSPIVYTESSRMPRQDYTAQYKDLFKQGRVVVIVNQNSASASEILSGAVQDNDRGVIVGRRTFGKGLVQRPFPFPDGSMIRLTISRYHTPSGRCIQRPWDNDNPDAYKNEMMNRYNDGELMHRDSVHLDSTQVYHTLVNKRTVYGGGGIMPDIFVPLDTTGVTPWYTRLVAKGLLNRYALKWVDNNRDELKKEYPDADAFLRTFEVTPGMMDEIVNLAKEQGIEPDKKQIKESTPLIATILRGMIGRDLFTQAVYYRAVLPQLSNEYRQALEIINDPQAYNALLK